jgi:iron complex transport system ATP-binding protein
VENGCFSYGHRRRPVLEHVSFSVGPGEIAAVLGPNGAGKTTLLRCTMGFLPWNSGKSCLNGKNIRSIPYRKLWQSVAYVPQAKNTAIPSYTVEQMILLGRSSRVALLAKPKKEDLQKAEEAMERLGIQKLKRKKCSELSGGELQMTLIARALVSEPQVLILDEPESNLDFKNQLLVLEAMSALAAEGMSCVFNTHYPAHALQRADKALLLGRESGPLFGDTHSVVTERNIELAFGVKAVIGEIETREKTLQDVLPLRLSGLSAGPEPEPEKPGLAAVAILSRGDRTAEKINGILHEFRNSIVGRMGLPYRARGVFVINVVLDAPPAEVDTLVCRLNRLPGVSVKATFAPEDFPAGGGSEKEEEK